MRDVKSSEKERSNLLGASTFSNSSLHKFAGIGEGSVSVLSCDNYVSKLGSKDNQNTNARP